MNVITFCPLQVLCYVSGCMFQVFQLLYRTSHVSNSLISGILIMMLSPGIASSNAKNPDVKSKIGKTTISGFTQVQLQATNRQDAVPSTTFVVRRGRLHIDAQLRKTLSMRLEFDGTTDGVETSDLYLKYMIGRHVALQAGQLKKPFSYIRLRAARRLRIIERPLHIRKDFRGYLGRDVGLLLEWNPAEKLEFALGLFNGSGVEAKVDNNNAKDFAARLELKQLGNLNLGMNISFHNVTEIVHNPQAVTNEKRFTAYGLDLTLNIGALNLVAEGLFADKPEIRSSAQMIGLYITGVYKREVSIYGIVSIEHGGRIEFKNSNDNMHDNEAICSVIPYIGLHFHSSARLQINPILRFPQQGDAVLEFIAQTQIEF